VLSESIAVEQRHIDGARREQQHGVGEAGIDSRAVAQPLAR